MVEQKFYKAQTDWCKKAVEKLLASGTILIAPKRDEQGVVNLVPVNSFEEIDLAASNVMHPLKRVFFPETEILFDYEAGTNKEIMVHHTMPDADKHQVILGSRPCDAASLAVMDRIFHWDYDDLRYTARRDRTTIVTIACAKPDATCFCTTVGGSPNNTDESDVLVFVDKSGQTILQTLTEKGGKFIESLGDIVQPAGSEIPKPPVDIPKRFDVRKVQAWLDDHFEDPFWFDISLRCLGCGSCTYQCPTCHCFDIVDEATWDHGHRVRNWDSCSFFMFTLHGSGHNPRPDQVSRYRQRILHKFLYFPQRFQLLACVGCGRCMKTCGAGQNLVDILAEIETK